MAEKKELTNQIKQNKWPINTDSRVLSATVRISVCLLIVLIILFVCQNSFFTNAKESNGKRKYIFLKTCSDLKISTQIDKWNESFIPKYTKQERYAVEINVSSKVNKEAEIKKGNDIVSICSTGKDEKMVITFECGEKLRDPVLLDCDGECETFNDIATSVINKTKAHHTKFHPGQ